ncbi:probable isoaspartyl peptidase/L-asparaginase 3 isoform X2 [Rosa rugosa]|uniref:probable isoaspartyl peptidase/L-asparaginase 3 isoform X2 n=1 Tax=Rosa rugosa TaxID=74645 RepID=UPI002B410D39|nr:probable isoaspartyl peptidase/L-asparaginase 3 isoform X2 [Rosa rugosa]
MATKTLSSTCFLTLTFLLLFLVTGHQALNSGPYPVVVSTWPFVEAVRAAWRAVDNGRSAVDAVVEGCSACEELRCDGTGLWRLRPRPQTDGSILASPSKPDRRRS